MPLMTERMVEALEIEDKTYEVHWYDDEAHGWERRENRRDAFERTLAFLTTHVPPDEEGRSLGRRAGRPGERVASGESKRPSDDRTAVYRVLSAPA